MAKAVVNISATCDLGHTVSLDEHKLEVEGGCEGGHGDDGYCYCPSAKVVLEWFCPECHVSKAHMRVELT